MQIAFTLSGQHVYVQTAYTLFRVYQDLHHISEVLICSGPARFGKGGGFSYDEWLGRKKSAEQKIINVRKAEEEKKRLEEDERYFLFVFCVLCIQFQ